MKNQICLIHVFVLCAFTAFSFAAPGDLDTTFGSQGIAILNMGSDDMFGLDLGFQSTGNIIIGGTVYSATGSQLVLTRLKPDGTVDTSFGTNGWVIMNFGYTDGLDCLAIAIQPDNKIVAGGIVLGPLGDQDFAVMRFHENGKPDFGFGNSGISVFGSGFGNDQLYDIAIQTDGKIVAVGDFASNNNGENFVIARLKPNGKLDSTFGGTGIVTADFHQYDDTSLAVAIQSDGKIVAVGIATQNAEGDDEWAAVRYTTGGVLDTTFSGDGKFTYNPGKIDDFANSVAIQPEGRVVIGGFAQGFDPSQVGVFYHLLLNPTATAYKTWVTDFPTSIWDAAYSVALTNANLIVTAGRAGNGTPDEWFALSCHNSTGTIRSTFGSNGLVTTNPGGGTDGISAIKIQTDNKIVAVGSYEDGTGIFHLVIARYLGCD